jgi:hypothetical protein
MASSDALTRYDRRRDFTKTWRGLRPDEFAADVAIESDG